MRFLHRVRIPWLFYSIALFTVALVIGATIRKFILLRKGGLII
ncbi:MAG TPA: hypothetical protein VK850_00715 [Candidatus Binatia bacterium]|nr:hypothetical protein [Candidatus Binatia bacterium]